MILSIDPATAAARVGWAIFDSNILTACGKQSPSLELLESVTEAIIEYPVIYPHGKTPNPNSIVKLAVSAGEMAGVLSANGIHVRYVEPRAWKGTLEAGACCRRVWSRLGATERALAAPFEPEPAPGSVKDSKTHTLDAIGLGLFAVGRWRK